MLCTAPTLRTTAIGCRLQPAVLLQYHTSSPSTSSSSHRGQDSTITKRRVSIPKRRTTFKHPSIVSLRHASSISSPNPTPTAASSTPSSSPTSQKLTWNDFFALRARRRWYQLGSSVLTCTTSFVGGAQLLTHSDMDAVVAQIPLDPFISLGLITFTCGGVGWLVGPVLGTGLFNLSNRKVRGEMDQKERLFYGRVKKWRVDPSASSMANPVPDYYGEKISSVAGYRRWLKDQRAFNKKRTTYIRS